MNIAYRLQPVDPDAHLFEIQLDIRQPDPAGQSLSLPNWIPGSYMIRDFSRNIVSMAATAGDEPVVLERIDKSRWRAPAGIASLQVVYQVYAWELSVRAAHLDRSHAFFNGTSVFLCVEGQQHSPVRVELLRPPASLAGVDSDAWEVATALPADAVDASGFGVYRADDYDALIDHPVEMGTFERQRFEVCGVAHELVLTGRYHTDTTRIVGDLTRICEQQIAFFGAPAPVDHYVFLVMVTADGYGGLEHRASTALMIGRDQLPLPGDDTVDDPYLEFLGLCSHEYFHTWNVKRIRPAVFVPFQLDAERYTRLLWFFEGVTSYYDDLFLVRSGLIDAERYLGLLARTITRVQRGAGRLTQSVTDSSFDAWHKFYKQDENAPNAIVSYYTKGALVALCLDATLREASEGEASLDTLMQQLWQQWLDAGAAEYPGLDEREPERLAATIAGCNLDDFFDAALYAVDELPLKDKLAHLGVVLHWRVRQASGDNGGVRDPTERPFHWLGATFSESGGGLRLRQVLADGPAQRAGLAPGDTVIAIDGQSIDGSRLDRLLRRLGGRDDIDLHYFRHGELRRTLFNGNPAPTDTASLVIDNSAQAEPWLHTTVPV